MLALPPLRLTASSGDNLLAKTQPGVGHERLAGVLEPEELEYRRRHIRGVAELAHGRPLSVRADRAIAHRPLSSSWPAEIAGHRY